MHWLLTFNIIYLSIFSRSSISTDSQTEKRKNILFIVADDLGWNDVGWNNPDMHTPNLDTLAENGIILNQSYVQPTCTPSRVSFMTGYFPYKLGLQQNGLRPLESNAVSLNYTMMPEKLKELNYSTHMIGKWHLGYCNKNFTPTSRGFDSFFGFYLGSQDHFYHNTSGVSKNGTKFRGYDFHYNYNPYPQAIGVYSTDLYAERTIEIINNTDEDKPFFIYLAFQNPHSPPQVPKGSPVSGCQNITNKNRRLFCGMVEQIDLAVGKIVLALKRRGLYNDTLIVFTSDNGGQVLHGGNNYPLRGNKGTIWEGGIRAPGFIHAKFLNLRRGYVSMRLFHAVDWYPTFIELAGGGLSQSKSNPKINTSLNIDGISQWKGIINASAPSPRNNFLINMIIKKKIFAGIRFGNFKLLLGMAGEMDDWYKPDNKKVNINDGMYSGGSGQTLNNSGINEILDPKFENYIEKLKIDRNDIWYFNIMRDPYEKNNIDTKDKVFYKMLDLLVMYRESYKSPTRIRENLAGNPNFYDGYFHYGWCDSY
ncbi:unnamed protein product [Gordionus sp. m RMFG-2023]|uniref:arylsulfatase B-like n=1 Tax=Gordionus sp. m RMFG-2023 TaxID=3053472 RepID=UPI0030DEB44E